MPIFDYECPVCGNVFETIAKIDEEVLPCNRDVCKGRAKRIISASGHYCGNEDTSWLSSVREVVNKNGGKHCHDFLKNPTRTNYKKWMKGEGLRPMEGIEKHKPEKLDMDRVNKYCTERYRKRNAIEVSG